MTIRPRVVVLGPLPPPYGGPETLTVGLVAALSHRTDLSVEHIDTQVSRSLAEKGGQYQLRKSVKGLWQALKVIVRLFAFRPHVLYVTLTNSPSFLGFLRDASLIVPALLLRYRVVARFNGGYYFYAHLNGWRARVVQMILGRVALAMVEGERLINVFNGVIPEGRIKAIQNAVDDEPFKAARALDRYRRGVDRKRVLFVGLLCAEKGVDDLVRSMRLVPDADFVFLGEWASEELSNRIQEFLDSHNLTERVKFHGVLTGPAKYEEFLSADVFAFPSYFIYEGHAVVSVEALAAGLPIICTDHGALNESVKDGWNGYFVPPRDPAAIAARINLLLADDALRRTMGDRSRQLYTERFTRERFVDRWVDEIVGCAIAAQGAR